MVADQIQRAARCHHHRHCRVSGPLETLCWSGAYRIIRYKKHVVRA